MSRILYLDASAGASGDMFVGALIGAGADPEVIRRHVRGLGLEGLGVRVRRVERAGIAGTKFDVLDPESGRPVDEIALPGGDGGGAHGGHAHGAGRHAHAGRGQRHPHGEHEGSGHGHHHHRGLPEIRSILGRSPLPGPVAADALGVFELLAAAEARVHGCAVDHVHFHEVGALDAIADIVAAASAVHQLGVDEIWCSPVHVGSGTVRCAHGVLPVPAPATAELLKGVPVYSDGTVGELCTPTGAALLRYFCRGFRPLPPMAVEAVGYGAGTKDFGIPNFLRCFVGEAPASAVREETAAMG
ncbi:MAG: LarC family nickel insertion protein [Candidatus Dadabacteria bacterium]|nr:MAG: LarC family nickel insertion protein [Candidatus Dadabacteria bacterium]